MRVGMFLSVAFLALAACSSGGSSNNGTAAEIRGGLKQGDVVILHPPDKLVDGGPAQSRQSVH